MYYCSLRMAMIYKTETSVINYHHSLCDNPEQHNSLLTLHYSFRIAHPAYAVHIYLFTIQYLTSSTVIKHFITQFSSGFCHFVTFGSRHFLSTPLSSNTLNPSYSFSDQNLHPTKSTRRITVCITILHLFF